MMNSSSSGGGVCSEASGVAVFHCNDVTADAYWLERWLCAYNSSHAHVSSILTAIGSIANALIVIVLLRKSMRSCAINILLVAIAICDMSLMVANFIYLRKSSCSLYMWTWGWMAYTLLYANVSVIAHALSLWLTVAMAVIRYYIIINKSHRSRSPHGVDRSARLSLLSIVGCTIIVLSGFSLNMLRNMISYEGEYLMPHKDFECAVPPGGRVNMSTYTIVQRDWYTCTLDQINYWLTGILFKLVPCVLLTVFMALLVNQLVQARRRHLRLMKNQEGASFEGDRTTVMLLAIVAVFLATELPQGSMNIATGIAPSTEYWYDAFGPFFDMLSLLNSSVNFLLYTTMSRQFRREFTATFCDPLLSYKRQKLQSSNTMGGGGRCFNSTPSTRVILGNNNNNQNNDNNNTNGAYVTALAMETEPLANSHQL